MNRSGCITGWDLAEYWSNLKNEKYHPCYVVGSSSYERFVHKIIAEHAGIAVNDEHGNRQAIEATGNWLISNPQRWDESAYTLITDALEAAYPLPVEN